MPDESKAKYFDKYYSGKKKRHTIKTQIVAEKHTRKIICLHNSIGKQHDFKLFKNSRVFIHPTIKAQTDTGYQAEYQLPQSGLLSSLIFRNKFKQ